MSRITSEIWQVGGAGFTATADAAVYLLCVDGQAAIIDAGCGGHGDRLKANIARCGVMADQVDFLLLTHCHFDHTGGAEDLRRHFDCKIVAHELDVPALEQGNSMLTASSWYGRTMKPLTVDIKLSGKHSVLMIGSRQLAVLHTPGHTPGSVVFLVESDGHRVLFGQDVHGPLHDDFASDPSAYEQSLTEMIDMHADILCEGHYGVYTGAKRVRAFIESFRTL